VTLKVGRLRIRRRGCRSVGNSKKEEEKKKRRSEGGEKRSSQASFSHCIIRINIFF
jgi:hypothetical protein